jgi:hypothetical protein
MMFDGAMEVRQRDLQATSVFGSVLCGALIGSILTSLLLLKLEIIPNGDKQGHMTFESLASIMLGVAAIVVGIILPLAGFFAFGFLRNDVKHKTEDFINDEIMHGKIHSRLEEAIRSNQKLVVDEIRSTFSDEQGLVRQYINSSVKEAFESLKAESQISDQNARAYTRKDDWGNEADDYGEDVVSTDIRP